jgi:hypothetical protein
MILRNIVLISAAFVSCHLFAAQPVASTTTVAPNVNTAKLIKPLQPVEPEVLLSIFVFDPTSNPNSGVEVTQNGKMWGSCRWGGLNAQPVSGQPSTKLCKFSASRGTQVNLTPSPAGPALAGLQCNSSGTGMCYKSASFALARDGQIEAAFNIKP